MPQGHLTVRERETIARLLDRGLSQADIARQLRRDPSTISRELRRNARGNGQYSAIAAQAKAACRRRHAKHPWKFNHAGLKEFVIEKLRMRWSPEQIAGTLQKLKEPGMRISAQTIYQWLRENRHQGGKLYLMLRQSRKKRRKRYGTGTRRPIIAGRKPISMRPAQVNSRQQSGHWESDTIEGRKGTGYLVTHVERTTGYLVAGWLPDKKSSTLNQASCRVFGDLKQSWVRTLTTDNGTEFAGHQELERALRCRIYFSDPHSPWQRGQCENTNGLLRQYFPKGSDFRKLTPTQIQAAVDELNGRPRKKYQYQSPASLLSRSRAFQI